MKFTKLPLVIIAIILLAIGALFTFHYNKPAQNHIVDWSKLSTGSTRIDARVNDTLTVKIYEKPSIGLSFVEARLVESTCIEETARKSNDLSNGLMGGDSIETVIEYKVISNKFCALLIEMNYRGEMKANSVLIN